MRIRTTSWVISWMVNVMYHVLGDFMDGECDEDLQEMLKMGIGILQSLPTE
jgi:hypothetical protein